MEKQRAERIPVIDLERQLTHVLRHDRSRALVEAIQGLVAPGTRVLDAGTGTGILAMLATRAGASVVTGVDVEDLTLAQELVLENGLADPIKLLRGDLTRIQLDAPFDAMCAFVYLNDVRRDEERSRLVFSLKDRLLRSEGKMLPDSVRYMVQPLAWPEQDIRTLRQRLLARVEQAERELGLTLGALKERLPLTPFRMFFPTRSLETGRIACDGATRLGEPMPAFTLDYRSSQAGYPSDVHVTISKPGCVTALLWSQELRFEGKVVFENECLTWVANPTEVAPGQGFKAPLDAHWRQTNEHTISISTG